MSLNLPAQSRSVGTIIYLSYYHSTNLSRAVKVDKYLIPNVSDLSTQLSGGTVYTTLDMSHAYQQQVVLDEESRPLTTINTSNGLFEFERLLFGMSSSPGIFQRIMEQLLQNIPMTTGRLPMRHPGHRKNTRRARS